MADLETSVLIAHLFVVGFVIYGTSLHEMGHAFVATWLGDPTPGKHGRLTWNPLPHLSPTMTAIIAPILFFLTSQGRSLFCLATTPVDPTKFRRPLRDHALVAVAGPFMNFMVMAVLIAICWFPGVILRYPERNFTTVILPAAAFWNLVLGVFNLMPVPPLDGYWITRGLLPFRIRRHTDALARHQGALFIAMIFGSLLFAYAARPVSNFFDALMPPSYRFLR